MQWGSSVIILGKLTSVGFNEKVTFEKRIEEVMEIVTQQS